MIKVTRTCRRSSADIPFYHETLRDNKLAQKKMYEKYVLTKKVISNSQWITDDKLEHVSITTWASINDLFDFFTDIELSRLQLDVQKKYEEENNITMILDIKDI